MTTCVTDVCGTGDWAGPKPGDPSTNSVLNAIPVWGGIRISWSWPSTNPHAVAHVQLYRNGVNDSSTAVQLAIVAGNHYTDPLESVQSFYYWIKIVSVNGTVSEFIGPAYATSVDTAEGMIEYLSGQIDRGVLAMSLKEELDRIELLNAHLLGEIASREDANVSLAQAIADAQEGVAQALTFVGQVNASRVSDNQAIVEQLGVVAATLQNGIAMVTDEARASVTRVEGLITAETTSRQQVTAQLDNKYAAITNSANTKISQLEGGLSAEISNRQQAITNVGGRVTGVESNMTVIANTLTNVYNAMWTVRLEAGGLIGGFGLYNNSNTVEAGFDVDRFWVGKSGLAVKPFIIDGGIVYMDKARIRNADIDTLKIQGNAVTVTNISLGGSSYVGSGGSTTLNQVWVDMGLYGASGSSGVVVQGHVSMVPAGNASMSLEIYRIRDGVLIGQVLASAQGGWYTSFTVIGWDSWPTAGGNGYQMILRNSPAGPGSNVSASVASSSLIASGGKR